MQVNNSYSNSNLYNLAQSNNAQVSQAESLEKDTITDESASPLASMSLDEIKSYLDDNNIEDEKGARSDILLEMQKFSGKVDSDTYDKMVNMVLGEKETSGASMRYSSFPSEKMLDENPQMFHAILETTTSMKDTAHALIFNLNLKQGLGDFAEGVKSSALGDNPTRQEDDTDFAEISLIAYIKKQLEELSEMSKDGLSTNEQIKLNDLTTLFSNYNSYDADTKQNNISILA